jgi:uncharacterized protein YceK
MRQLTAAQVTIALALTVTCTAMLSGNAAIAKKQHAAKTTAASSKLIAQGKTLASTMGCNKCHSADLSGKKGFSPSLHASGVLKEYNPKSWAVVLDTGVTNDGGMVKKPMPAYHMPATKAAALYAYCKTLK